MGTPDPVSPSPPASEPRNLPTLAQEWVLIGIVSALIITCLTIDLLTFPKDMSEGKKTPMVFVAAILAWIGQGLWITMDRKRRGLEVGMWRFGAICIGPFIIPLYLATEYKLRALYLIPLAALIYGNLAVMPAVIVTITKRFG